MGKEGFVTSSDAGAQGHEARIRDLHQQAGDMWPQLEQIIDELKRLAHSSPEGDNALQNVRQWLAQLSRR